MDGPKGKGHRRMRNSSCLCPPGPGSHKYQALVALNFPKAPIATAAAKPLKPHPAALRSAPKFISQVHTVTAHHQRHGHSYRNFSRPALPSTLAWHSCANERAHKKTEKAACAMRSARNASTKGPETIMQQLRLHSVTLVATQCVAHSVTVRLNWRQGVFCPCGV